MLALHFDLMEHKYILRLTRLVLDKTETQSDVTKKIDYSYRIFRQTSFYAFKNLICFEMRETYLEVIKYQLLIMC